MNRSIRPWAALTMALGALCLTDLAPAQPDPPSASRPNVLFLLADDQTFRSLGAINNDQIQTPNLDQLAAQGTVMRTAVNQGSWSGAVCICSRAMLLTGRHLYNVGGQSCGPYTLWPQAFGESGYDTFVTGKWHNGKASLTRSFTQGQSIFLGGMSTIKNGGHWSPTVHPFDPTGQYPKDQASKSKKHSSELFADAAIDFIESRASDTDPFFMWVSFLAPHDPRQSPKAFTDLYPPESIQIPPNFLPEHPFDQGDHRIRDEMLAPFPRTEEDVQQHIADYYAIITHLDAQIGRVLDALDDADLAHNTIVVFTADHGLAVGQHGLMGKQNQYDHSIRAPMILKGPGVGAGKTVNAQVYLHSLYPTLCDLAGIETPDSVESLSFAPLLAGDSDEIYPTLYGTYKDLQHMVRSPRYKLIEYPKANQTQLFDLVNDPWEMNDLAEDPAFEPLVQRLRAELARWRPIVGDTDSP
jgi:arylsulfatase A-like enzyme